MKTGQVTRVEWTSDPQAHTNVWVECKCGHSFWWDTYQYGPNIVCSECDQAFYTMVMLLETCPGDE